MMNPDGTNQTRVLTSTHNDAYPTFNAAGSKIAFQSDRAGVEDIYTMNSDGTQLTLLPNQSGNNILPNW